MGVAGGGAVLQPEIDAAAASARTAEPAAAAASTAGRLLLQLSVARQAPASHCTYLILASINHF